MSIILNSIHPEDRIFAQGAADACQQPLLVETTIENAIKAAKEAKKLTALLLSMESESQVRQTQADLKTLDTNKVHLILGQQDSAIGEVAFNLACYGNVILRRFEDVSADGRHYGRVILACLDAKTPGLKNLFPIANIRTLELRNRNEKDFVADSVFTHLQTLDCSQRVAQTVASAVDELLLNAVIHVHSGTSQSWETAGPQLEKELIHLQMGSDGQYAGVSVIASQRTSDRSSIFTHLAKAFSRTALDPVSESHPGFALGLSLILKSGASLRFFCNPTQFMEITVVFRKTQKLLEFRNQFQFVSTDFV